MLLGQPYSGDTVPILHVVLQFPMTRQPLVPRVQQGFLAQKSATASKLRSHPVDYSSSLLSYSPDLDGLSNDGDSDDGQQEHSASASRVRTYPLQLDTCDDENDDGQQEESASASRLHRMRSYPLRLDTSSDDENDDGQQGESTSASRLRSYALRLDDSVSDDESEAETNERIGAVEQQNAISTVSQVW